jgi:two-component sensor histidine kinase
MHLHTPLLSALSVLAALFFSAPLVAQEPPSSIPGLTVFDYARRNRMTGEMFRHRSLDSFRVTVMEEYERAPNDASREKLIEFWVSQLAATFGEYDESNALIDSILSVPDHFMGHYSKQSLQVRQFSNFSDKRFMKGLEMYTDTFLTRVATGNLRLNDTIDYYILAVVLSEVEEFAAAQEVLSIIAYHGRERPTNLWRSYLTMASLYTQADDYGKALEKTELFLPLTDTTRMNLAACGSAYSLAGSIYDYHKMYDQSYYWADQALIHLAKGQVFERKISTANRCNAAMKLEGKAVKSLCNPILSAVSDTTLPNLIQEMLLATAFDYLRYDRRSLKEVEKCYADWSELRESREIPDDKFAASFLSAALRLSMLKQGDRLSPAVLDSLISLWDARIKNKSSRINNDLAEKYQTRIRQDSISQLTLRSRVAETETANQQRQLWLLLALLAAVAGGLFFFRREARKRRQLNEELKFRNNRISLLNADINHRTNHYLTSIIRLLQEQQYKAQQSGIEVSAVNDLERQILVYTKLQRMLKTDDEKTVVNLKAYLEELITTIKESFQVAGDPVELNLTIDELTVNPDFAAPLGLIINELLTNSVKYARRRNGMVRATLSCQCQGAEAIHLRYADDGPADKPDTEGRFSSGSGLELIEGLTMQLEGKRRSVDGFGYEAEFEL